MIHPAEYNSFYCKIETNLASFKAVGLEYPFGILESEFVQWKLIGN